MMTQEKLQHYIEQLRSKHDKLHKLIEAAEAEKAPDHFVTKLKKEKLELKDSIYFHQRRLETYVQEA